MEIRVALLYATVGTGHRTAALALGEWFRREGQDVKVQCLDVLSFSSPLVRGFISRSYLEMVKRAPRLWGYFYDTLDDPEARDGLLGSLNEMTAKLNLRRLKRRLEAFGPHALFCTHFFGAGPLAEAFAPQVPLYYVNTDFLSHVFHRNRLFAGWFVAGPEAARQYAADGITEKVHETGIPVFPAYASPPGREEARAALNLPREGRVVLVISGGIGVGPIEEAVASLARRRDWTTLVVCGNNQRLLRRMRKLFSGASHVRIEGFVENILEHYAASDLVVMKPGGLCTSEVLCLGLPILLMDPIPGQEQRNSDYLLDRGAARVLFEVRRTAERAEEILEDPAERARLREACARLARPYAGREVVRTVFREQGWNQV